MIITLVGRSGSGKTTLGQALASRLRCKFVDGTQLRDTAFARDVGFSAAERRLNLLRVSYMLSELAGHEDIVWACGCPLAGVLAQLPVDFIVYLDATVQVCEARDVKGYYEKARAGGDNNLPGVTMPFEAPLDPDLVIDTGEETVHQCLQQLLTAVIAARRKLRP